MILSEIKLGFVAETFTMKNALSFHGVVSMQWKRQSGAAVSDSFGLTLLFKALFCSKRELFISLEA